MISLAVDKKISNFIAKLMVYPDRGRGRGGFRGGSRGRGGFRGKSHHYSAQVDLLTTRDLIASYAMTFLTDFANRLSFMYKQAYGPSQSHQHTENPDEHDDGSIEYLNRKYGSMYSPMFTQDPWQALLISKP